MKLEGHDVRIEQEDFKIARVYIDGKELKGVQDISYRIGINDVPSITVEFIPSTLNKAKEDKKLIANINIDGDEIVKMVMKSIKENKEREVIL